MARCATGPGVGGELMRRRAKGIKRQIEAATKNVEHDMSMHDGSLYAKGFAGEGYNGGYCAALRDVLLALNGVTPNRNGWWDTERGAS